MCGIVGYVGHARSRRSCSPGSRSSSTAATTPPASSLQGERRLEAVRAVGNLAQLREAVAEREPATAPSRCSRRRPRPGIGHTRWATHGRVTEENAHPHFDTDDRVHVVVNGIVENYMELKQELLGRRRRVHLRDRRRGDRPPDLAATSTATASSRPCARAYARLRGHYAFVAVAADEPDLIVGARKECPLVVGRGDGEQFLGSGDPRLPRAHAPRAVHRERRDRRRRPPTASRFIDADGTPVERAIEEVDWDAEAAEKGGYETFMLKEIHEQADAVAETIADRTARGDGVDLGDLGAIDDEFLRTCRRIVVVACGTSYHAGLIGRYAIEEWARVPVEMDIASEYRYRNPVVGPGDLVDRDHAVGRDRRHAGRDAPRARARRDRARAHQRHGLAGHARRRRRAVHARRPGDRRRRDEDVRRPGRRDVPARRCGIAELRGTLDARAAARAGRASSSGSRTASRSCSRASRTPVERVAAGAPRARTSSSTSGRHVGLPVALEGALKLKEISYIATDAYAAGEMKHGPIALLDEDDAGRLRRDRLAGAREGRLEHAGGPRARRARDRRRDRGQRRDRRARRGGPLRCRRPTGCCSRCSR